MLRRKLNLYKKNRKITSIHPSWHNLVKEPEFVIWQLTLSKQGMDELEQLQSSKLNLLWL